MIAPPSLAPRLLYQTEAGVDQILWAWTYKTGRGQVAIGADGLQWVQIDGQRARMTSLHAETTLSKH
jgi:hypothetical protein